MLTLHRLIFMYFCLIQYFANNGRALAKQATMLEEAPAPVKTLLPPHQGLLFILLESLPHAVSGDTRDDRGCSKDI